MGAYVQKISQAIVRRIVYLHLLDKIIIYLGNVGKETFSFLSYNIRWEEIPIYTKSTQTLSNST